VPGSDRPQASFRYSPARGDPGQASRNAIVAAGAALYAALVAAGADPPSGAPPADEATGLAKRILLAWADHGFRDAHRALDVPAKAVLARSPFQPEPILFGKWRD
jgi:hypothetical protein